MSERNFLLQLYFTLINPRKIEKIEEVSWLYFSKTIRLNLIRKPTK